MKPLEEDIRRRGETMQLNGSAKGSGSEPQGIPLGRSPSAPVDDYREIEREDFLNFHCRASIFTRLSAS
jgi:hypothetical protein